MVKKSKENVEIIAQKIFLEPGHLNVHDLFKKKTFEINLPLMKLIKHRCYFVFFLLFLLLLLVILLIWQFYLSVKL